MSNPTPEAPGTPEVIEGTVIIDPTAATATVVPKTPGKFKTALRHPIQTIKRHNVVSTALAGVVVGVGSTLLVLHMDKDEDGTVTEDSPKTSTEDSEVIA